MYTRSYSFISLIIRMHIARTFGFRLNVPSFFNQAGRNNYPYNPKFVGNTGNRTSDSPSVSVYKPALSRLWYFNPSELFRLWAMINKFEVFLKNAIISGSSLSRKYSTNVHKNYKQVNKLSLFLHRCTLYKHHNNTIRLFLTIQYKAALTT